MALNRVLVVPLTSNTTQIHHGGCLVEVAGRAHKASASQLTTASKVRLGQKFGELTQEDLYEVETVVIDQLGLS